MIQVGFIIVFTWCSVQVQRWKCYDPVETQFSCFFFRSSSDNFISCFVSNTMAKISRVQSVFFHSFSYECCSWICCITAQLPQTPLSVLSRQTRLLSPSTCQSWYLHLFFLFETLPQNFCFFDFLIQVCLSGREGHIDIDGICSTWKCTAPKIKSAELCLHRIIALSTWYLNTIPCKHNYETYLYHCQLQFKLIFDLIVLRIPLQKMFFWAI